MVDRLPEIQQWLQVIDDAHVEFTIRRSEDGDQGSITISEGSFDDVRLAADFIVHIRDIFGWLVTELEGSRGAGDQLRAVLDEAWAYARAGAEHFPAHPGFPGGVAEVERLASKAMRLLGAIHSPDEAAQVAGGGGSR